MKHRGGSHTPPKSNDDGIIPLRPTHTLNYPCGRANAPIGSATTRPPAYTVRPRRMVRVTLPRNRLPTNGLC